MRLWLRQSLVSIVVLGVFAALAWPFAAAPRWQAALGTAGDVRVAQGVWGAEVGPDGRAFRRLQAQTTLVAHGVTGGAPLALTLDVFGGALPLTATVALAEQPVAVFNAPAQWRTVHLVLPAARTSPMQPFSLTLTSATFRPGADDQRDLGVAVAGVALAPLGRTWPWPGVFAAWWLFLVGGVFVLGVHNLATRWKRVVVVLSMLIWGALAAALIVWTWRAPGTLAYWLAPAPWLLGVATWALLTPWAVAALRARFTMPLLGVNAAFVVGMALLVVAQTLLWLRLGAVGALLAGYVE